MFDYFVTVGYYTLTEFSKVEPSGEYYNEECDWWDINNKAGQTKLFKEANFPL